MDASPELGLVVACLASRVGGGAENITRRLSGPLDWNRVVRLARAHTVLPLLRSCLLEYANRVPATAAALIAREYVAGSTLARALTDELARLFRSFRDGQVEVLAYKGPALAIQVYGDVHARAYRDLDLIVRPAEFERARTMLLANGYRPAFADVGRTPERIIRLTECDESFVHVDTGVLVELHWAITPPYLSMAVDVEQLFQRAITVESSELEAETVCPEDALVLLCINGTKDGWGRLETVLAMAELIYRHPELDWQSLGTRVRGLRVCRMWHVGLALTRALFGLRLPAPVAAEETADARAQQLVSEVRARLFSEQTDRLSLFQRMSFIARSREVARDRWRVWGRRLLTPSHQDAALVRLPQLLWPIYYLLRPMRLLSRRLVRRSPHRPHQG